MTTEASARRILGNNYEEDCYPWLYYDVYHRPVVCGISLGSAPSIRGLRTVGDFLSPTLQHVDNAGNRWDIDRGYCGAFDAPNSPPRESEEAMIAERFRHNAFAKYSLHALRKCFPVELNTGAGNDSWERTHYASDPRITSGSQGLWESSSPCVNRAEPEGTIIQLLDRLIAASQGDVQSTCFCQQDNLIYRPYYCFCQHDHLIYRPYSCVCQQDHLIYCPYYCFCQQDHLIYRPYSCVCQQDHLIYCPYSYFCEQDHLIYRPYSAPSQNVENDFPIAYKTASCDIESYEREPWFPFDDYFHREDILSEASAMLPTEGAPQSPSNSPSSSASVDLNVQLAEIFGPTDSDVYTSRDPAAQRSEAAENVSHSGQWHTTQGTQAENTSHSGLGHMTQGTQAENTSHSGLGHMTQGTDAEFNRIHTSSQHLEWSMSEGFNFHPFDNLVDYTSREAVGQDILKFIDQFGDQVRPENDLQDREVQYLAARLEMAELSIERWEDLCQRASEDHQHLKSEYQRQIAELHEQITTEQIRRIRSQVQTLKLMVQVIINKVQGKQLQALVHLKQLYEAMNNKTCTLTVREVLNTYQLLRSYVSDCNSLKRDVEVMSLVLQEELLMGEDVDLSTVEVRLPDYPELPEELHSVLGYSHFH